MSNWLKHSQALRQKRLCMHVNLPANTPNAIGLPMHRNMAIFSTSAVIYRYEHDHVLACSCSRTHIISLQHQNPQPVLQATMPSCLLAAAGLQGLQCTSFAAKYYSWKEELQQQHQQQDISAKFFAAVGGVLSGGPDPANGQQQCKQQLEPGAHQWHAMRIVTPGTRAIQAAAAAAAAVAEGALECWSWATGSSIGAAA